MMESRSTWSEICPSSDDSGLLLTSGQSDSVSTDSGDSAGCNFEMELQESNEDDKSISPDESDETSGDNFNTLKKGPGLVEVTMVCTDSKHVVAIEPPPEFQDSPPSLLPNVAGFKYKAFHRDRAALFPWVEKFASKLMSALIEDAIAISCKVSWSMECSQECHPTGQQPPAQRGGRWSGPRLCWTPELLPFSPRPGSRTSLASSRLSSSHNSLSVPTANKADDSSFITSAMSHDVLTASEISDMYNVPFDSDIYAVPIDVVRPTRTPQRPRRRLHRKRRRNTGQSEVVRAKGRVGPPRVEVGEGGPKRHSVPGPSVAPRTEPIHMTLHEVRQYLQNLYSSSSDSGDNKGRPEGKATPNNIPGFDPPPNNNNNNARKHKKNTFVINMKNKKAKEMSESRTDDKEKGKKSGGSFSTSLKQTLCNIFRIRKLPSPDHNRQEEGEAKPPFFKRALPPLPARTDSCVLSDSPPLPSPDDTAPGQDEEELEIPAEELSMDFASSIEKVKDYGWYWGPISGEAAEKILSNEPDGSFIVRDSSDDHYIFSLTFKLNSCIRHVRIEHDQGNFSFGSCTKFKSHTIVDFIENAVEHSRSGRYLFFLHRRPVLGPMRVQLLHPVSRFKQVQSLQHMCRFVILKLVRKDLIPTLPLPRRVIDYLSTPHYYSEQLVEDEHSLGPSPSAHDVDLFSFVPQDQS